HLLRPNQDGVVDLDRGFGPCDLYRRRLAEEVGERIKQPYDQGRQHGEVFPEGVAVHRRSTRDTKGAQDGSGSRVRATGREAPSDGYSDLIVPFGRTFDTELRCRTTSTGLSASSATSRVM